MRENVIQHNYTGNHFSSSMCAATYIYEKCNKINLFVSFASFPRVEKGNAFRIQQKKNPKEIKLQKLCKL